MDSTPRIIILPGFTWGAMLKHTRVKFKLLTDIDMVMFIERDIRLGRSQCSNARINNKYMQSIHRNRWRIICTLTWTTRIIGQCINHYRTDFWWIDDVDNFDVTTIASNLSTNSRVVLEYPQHLHDAPTQTYHSVQRARNHPTSERRSSSLRW